MVLQGMQRVELIDRIATEIQAKVKSYRVKAYLEGFSVEGLPTLSNGESKRLYVCDALENVDGDTIYKIAQDLRVATTDILEIENENQLSSQYIKQQIEKCHLKMDASDYDGAITNARTLLEEVLCSIDEKLSGCRHEYKGDLKDLYKIVAKQFNMDWENRKEKDAISDVLRGFATIINGFSCMSNGMADRHATVKRPRRHHAKLAVNSALVITEFLVESYEYQQTKLSQSEVK